MLSFATPSEAKSVLISIILEQASIAGVSLSEFEHKLLHTTETDESPTEEELEQFDDEQGEEYWDKIALLIKQARSRIRSEGGLEAQKEFNACIELAAQDNGYLSGILFLRNFTKLNGQSAWITTLQIAGGSVIGSVLFLIAIIYFWEHSPASWIESHAKPVRAITSWVSDHTTWISNPYGLFQQYAGLVMLAALFAYAVYAYGSILRDFLRRKQ